MSSLNTQDNVFKQRALAILRVIEGSEEVSQREIAERIDSSLGTTNQALKVLIDEGVVRAEGVTTSKGKRGFLYHLTPQGLEERFRLTRDYLNWRKREVEAISQEIESLEAELNGANR
jgi:EPS-associated MarR family transcriptional regulator